MEYFRNFDERNLRRVHREIKIHNLNESQNTCETTNFERMFKSENLNNVKKKVKKNKSTAEKSLYAMSGWTQIGYRKKWCTKCYCVYNESNSISALSILEEKQQQHRNRIFRSPCLYLWWCGWGSSCSLQHWREKEYIQFTFAFFQLSSKLISRKKISYIRNVTYRSRKAVAHFLNNKQRVARGIT